MSSDRKAYFAIIFINKPITQGCPVTEKLTLLSLGPIFKKPIIQGCPVTGKPTLLLLSTNLLFKEDVQWQDYHLCQQTYCSRMSSNRKAYFAIIIANKSFIQGCPVTFNRKTYFAIIIFKKPIIQGCPVTGKPTLLLLLLTSL